MGGSVWGGIPNFVGEERSSSRAVLQEVRGVGEGLGHFLGRDGAGEQHMALQREARHTLDAGVARPAVGRGDLREAALARQQRLQLMAVQAALFAELGQYAVVADVGAVAEIAFEQRLDDAVLQAPLAGEADEAVGIERIGRAGQSIEVEFQPHRGGGLGDALVELLRALEAAELGDAVLRAVDTFPRHVGVQLEGMPGDGEAQVLLLEEIVPALELSVADIAPGTDHVADDVDTANGLGLIHGGFLPYCARVYTCGKSAATRSPSCISPNTALL